MSLKYEKPLIIPFNSDRDETGLGSCSPGGTFTTAKCQSGNEAGVKCQTGGSAEGSCIAVGQSQNVS